MDAVHPLNGLALRLRSPQLVMRVDPANDQNASLDFYFTGNFRDQIAVARINLARFQRTAKSSGQSPAGCGDDVIQRGCAGREFARRDLVMPGDFGMHSKCYRVIFGRNIS